MQKLVLLSLLLCSGAFAVVNIPLQGDIPNDGEFWAPLGLGTPVQSFKLQIDTGSADLLVYSVGCTGCGSNIATFNPAASSSDRRVLCNDPIYNCAQSGCSGQYCNFDDQYGDGSHVSGQVVTDIFNIGGLQANISFGMIKDSSKNFEPTGVDGIWGLAWYVISDWNGTSAFQNVVNQLGLPDRFMMCLTPDSPLMQLGGPSSDNGFSWTKVIQKSYYVVQFNDLQVDGKSLGIDPSVYNSDPGAIVDSGTTLFIIPMKAFTAMYTAFKAMCSSVSLKGVCGMSQSQSIFAQGGASQCAKMSSDDIAQFPNITVLLDGVIPLSIGGAQYLFPLSEGCYSMGVVGDSGGGTIMGDVFMQAFAVVFDRTNMKVGFGNLDNCPSNVDRSHLPAHTPIPYGAQLRTSPRQYNSAHHNHGVLTQA